MDVPSSCGGNPAIDCPAGTPEPPANQLRVSSTRAIQTVLGTHRYDLTVTQSVQTLQDFKMTYNGVTCEVGLASANGQSPSWTMQVQLDFSVGGNTSKTYISPSNVQVSGIEDADYTVRGETAEDNLLCSASPPPKSAIAAQYKSWFANYLICTAPGPAYLGRCSSQP